MDTTDSQVVIKEGALGNYLMGGIFLVVAGFVAIVTTGEAWFFSGIMAIVALAMVLFSSSLTIIADRTTQTLTLAYRSLFNSNEKTFRFADIVSIDLAMSRRDYSANARRRRKTTYRIEMTLKDGQVVPFRSYYSSGLHDKQGKVNQLRTVLGQPPVDYSLGGLVQAASSSVAEAYNRHQQAISGPQGQMQETNGVQWMTETRAFGAQPVTRWFSPDFKTPDSFTYLAQTMPGQNSLAGGLLGGIGDFLFKQSISIYGFDSQDTPHIDQAKTIESLDPRLAPHFTGFTSHPQQSRQLLNAWMSLPLVQWVERYPLRQGDSNQLVLMYSPKGTTLAVLGTVSQQKMDELISLGIEMVKSQT